MSSVNDYARSRTVLHEWTPLDDPRTRRLAEACLLRNGKPLAEAAPEVAKELGMCADTLCALLGVKADQ